MVRRSRKEAQRLIKAIAVLLRNTTWKCGKVERLVVNYLRKRFPRKVSIGEMLKHYKLEGKRRYEFLDAIKRLAKRRIILLES